jgi:phage terminase large subunit-like protein
MMHPLQHIHDPNFKAVFFRRVTKQLVGLGGLWQESQKMYQGFNPHVRQQSLTQTFESGAELQFSHMEHEKDRLSHQGLQYSAQFWDELTHFSETQFTYLLSRLRSDSEVKSYCMASCNPDSDSWVLNWIEWWLDEDGYPDPAKKGVVRYYMIVDDKPYFADSEEEMREMHPEKCKVWNPNKKEWVIIPIKTITFIGGTIFDNQILIDKNPNYLAELNSLPEIEKARLLDGNWYARAEGSNYFKREWLNKVDKRPSHAKCARGWDKAANEPSTKERRPDYTASIKMYKDKDGYYTIVGDFVDENVDEEGSLYGLMRKRAGARDAVIEKQGHYDGRDCKVVLPIDPGAAGKTEYLSSAKKLIEAGLTPKSDPSAINEKKVVKFMPFSSACENGLVSIIESSFGNKATLEAFYKQLESFSEERSSRSRKDDWPDSCATTYNYLSKENTYKFSPRTQNTVSTETVKVLNNTDGLQEQYQSLERPDVSKLN